jgi:hypothetical protein
MLAEAFSSCPAGGMTFNQINRRTFFSVAGGTVAWNRGLDAADLQSRRLAPWR